MLALLVLSAPLTINHKIMATPNTVAVVAGIRSTEGEEAAAAPRSRVAVAPRTLVNTTFVSCPVEGNVPE